MPRARRGGGKKLLGSGSAKKTRIRGGGTPPAPASGGDFSKMTDPVAQTQMSNVLGQAKALRKQMRPAQKAARGGLKLGKGRVR